jgi:hypothetical protein
MVNLERLGLPTSGTSIEEFMESVIIITEKVYNENGHVFPQLFFIFQGADKYLKAVGVMLTSAEEAQFFFESGVGKELALNTETKIKGTFSDIELSAYLIAASFEIRKVPPEIGEAWQVGLIPYEEVVRQCPPQDILGYILVQRTSPEPQIQTFEISGKLPHTRFTKKLTGPQYVGTQSRFLLHLWGE